VIVSLQSIYEYMKKTIENPYKMNWILYMSLLIISGAGVGVTRCHFLADYTTIITYVQNISFGVFSSAFVAMLIEYSSVKERNQKADAIYFSVYRDLYFNISEYITCWAKLCKIAFKDKKYEEEKHTWIEWYDIVKTGYYLCEKSRQKELIVFFSDELNETCEYVMNSIQRVVSQYYLLGFNDVLNQDLKRIIDNFEFEFTAAIEDLQHHNKEPDLFWKNFDAINLDLCHYIDSWIDIKLYNQIVFRPYHFLDDRNKRIV